MRFLFLLLCLLTSPAFAQDVPPKAASNNVPAADAHALVPNGDNSKPVAIEADNQLEWLRGENKFRADGHVVITQGATSITGDKAEASYDPGKGPSALTVMTVTGNVVIHSGENVITSETAEYDTRTQIAQLRGKTVSLASPKATVEAADGMDYDAGARKATSIGPAVVKQGGDTIKADRLTAWLTDKNELRRADAQGRVLITQKTKDGTSIAQADRGAYDAVKKTAELTGNVKLTQGENHMQGDKATIDLATGYSSLQNAAAGGRVRAVFTPSGTDDFMPNVQSTVPAIKPKQDFEQPYAVGGRP